VDRRDKTQLQTMKVIGINGSARKNGNTTLIISKVFDELNKEGIECELIQLADYEILPCRGCFACKGRGNCVFTNDGFAEIFNLMVEADGIILGSPVYSADVSAKMKAFLERGGVVVASNQGILRHKIGASVAAVRRGGGMTTVDTMNHFMLNKEMIVVGSTYWNMVYGKNIGDVLNDEEGMANMRNLGENMSYVLKKFRL
ncbi:flavodoxin family protein, partial [uncultured Duncaniella sp.]|uniref:flavodoxin family protein n=2 Tax=uncultured Duncaniella sp. TaxID=2768039 RepID=UPI0025B647C0